ncbi:microfibril-associated glycoprotein 4-like isoform X2 [Dendronephthya gigantea]|uniref:microfibril-associated glycoprotein 4-like isoform X2 n=1 Tax=Dendronephthya gigantea TaxID=151771 RepID=UPI00106CA03C|nr:microfibril-associated glycoprotein 4-like isoform X2 [Dendronephthya gigantea]
MGSERMLTIALQTGCTGAHCCDEIKSDIKNLKLVQDILCSKHDPRYESCCGDIKRDIQKKKQAHGILCEKEVAKKSCADLYKSGVKEDGVYTIDPDGLGSFNVSCDMTTDGGGWTVFQRRQDGSQDFFLGWSDYKAGFGDLNGEFWLGLDKIHRLTKSGQNVLRIDLMDFKSIEGYAKYGEFSVADESDKYRLKIGDYSAISNAGDSLTYHNQMQFTTRDSDNDLSDLKNCAKQHEGAWWYKACFQSNLNGKYLDAGAISSKGIVWFAWENSYSSLKETEMKIRPNKF